ncbi:unnamed protein product [Clonostachys rosea]|uniref:F-box domain-containing protein n=1 Tax=Bionectria ochroleuca TaxID=29856 RepID=A0ABY6U4K2_BIOOC|nr:unnamed protein product [Clonostachys rosea]
MFRPPISTCVLCGCTIRYSDWLSNANPWLRHYRGLLPHPDTGLLVVTGVGILWNYSDAYLAPWDYNARGDQPGFENRDPDKANDHHQANLRPRSEIIFHEACWSLLMRYIPFQDDPEKLDNFYHVCISLPYPLKTLGLSWGHDYGGVAVRHDKGQFPWEDYRYTYQHLASANPKFVANPLDAGTANTMISMARQSLLQSAIVPEPPISPNGPDILNQGDLLNTYPNEILCHIASFLSTSDFLNLRLASRACCVVFYVQSFWRTRFMGHGERAWLFEAAHQTRGSISWLSLHHQTKDSKIDAFLRNRKRIWNLFKYFPEYIARNWMEPPIVDLNIHFQHFVSGHLQTPIERDKIGFEEGCRIMKYRKLSTFTTVDRIRAYLITFEDASYIAGLELYFEPVGNNPRRCDRVGYQTLKSQTISIGFKLQGMIIAVGSRGIHAIKFTGIYPQVSSWLGSPRDSPRTQRLAFHCPMGYIQTCFDVRNSQPRMIYTKFACLLAE